MKQLKKFKSFINESIDSNDLLDIQDVVNNFVEDNDINKAISVFEINRGKVDTMWLLYDKDLLKIGIFKFYYIFYENYRYVFKKTDWSDNNLFKKLETLVSRISNMGFKSKIGIDAAIRNGFYKTICFTLHIDEEIIT